MMKIGRVVSNSSPIIFLSAIGQLSLLNTLFNQIYIPKEVYNEIVTQTSSEKPGHMQLKEAVFSNKIRIYDVQNKPTRLIGKLHAGELEAIIAARELNIKYILLDDLAARKMAENLALSLLGTIGFLMHAKQQGKIDQIKKHLDKLIEHKFRLSKKLYNKVLSAARED